MRKFFVASLGIVTVAFGSTGVALAADIKAPVLKAPPAVVYNWSGFYIGAHVGGAWGTKDWFNNSFDDEIRASHNVSGMIAGGQIGFNWQAPGSNWVLGVEGQMSWADLNGDRLLGDDLFKTKVKWLATVAGRLGYAWDGVLLYAKGGLAYARDEHQFADTNDGVVDPLLNFAAEKRRTGWMVGGGLEFALGANWSAKAEYNFMDFGNKSVLLSPVAPTVFVPLPFDIDQQIHVAKFGINYRFGGPVAARY
jgi:outer membrane immunogenic protein